MAVPAAHLTEVQNSSGFRIETSADALTVIEARSAGQRLTEYAIYALLIGWCVIKAVSEGQYFILVIAAALAIGILRGLSIHNVRCGRDNLEVIDVFCGRTTGTRSYAQTDVKRIRFGAVSFSKYGSVGGLIFEVSGERVKVLYGLKCIEAQKILSELQRLGFDVLVDVGMPMMVEMEQSRRRSWLGRLFN
jgi:hypothetical protein